MWLLEKIEITGGFLPGLSVDIPRGLTCIIGPRGSGKSTLAEAIRFALCGLSAAPKHCIDLIQANLAGGALVTITGVAEGSNRYVIKRGLNSNPCFLHRTEERSALLISTGARFCPGRLQQSRDRGHRRRGPRPKASNLLDELRSEQMRPSTCRWPRVPARWRRTPTYQDRTTDDRGRDRTDRRTRRRPRAFECPCAIGSRA